jgi:hypothetical protein
MSFLILIGCLQLPTSATEQPPWRISANQPDDQGAFGFSDASLAAGARAIAKSIESLLVEAMNALAHRLRVAPHLRSDLRGTKSIPTAGDHPSTHNPIAWSVTAVSQLMYFLLLSRILRGTGAQQFGHVLGSFPR